MLGRIRKLDDPVHLFLLEQLADQRAIRFGIVYYENDRHRGITSITHAPQGRKVITTRTPTRKDIAGGIWRRHFA